LCDRKKKKKKEHDKIKEIVQHEVKSVSGTSNSKKHLADESKTKAELAFEKIREQRVSSDILHLNICVFK